MALRLTKLEAAAGLNVSGSAIGRMIRRGALPIQKVPTGSGTKCG